MPNNKAGFLQLLNTHNNGIQATNIKNVNGDTGQAAHNNALPKIAANNRCIFFTKNVLVNVIPKYESKERAVLNIF